MAALGSSRDGARSVVGHKKECKANKVKLEGSFRESESRLSDAQRRVKGLELTKDSVDQLASRVDGAEKALCPSQENV